MTEKHKGSRHGAVAAGRAEGRQTLKQNLLKTNFLYRTWEGFPNIICFYIRMDRPVDGPALSLAVQESAVQTPTPGVTAIRLYAYGRELMVADGFTLYVGDKPVEITAVLEPDVPNAQVGWTFSNQEAASLDVSSDGRTCTITALKPTGRNDITVVCQDVTTSMPVFLWEK